MTTPRHTPGDWHCEGYRVFATDADGKERSIACLYEAGLGVTKANGDLIAAGPELLVALKALWAWQAAECQELPDDALTDQVLDAIAAAEPPAEGGAS